MMYLTESLSPLHNRKGFSCGNELLNNYLQYQANQDIKRKLNACFVLTDKKTNLVQGYYTLSNNSIPLDLVPEKIKKKLPGSYSSIPTTLLGRLAVDIKLQGRGIGKLLLIDALKRSFQIAEYIGSFAILVDPIDKEAEDFYTKYGFIKLPDSGKMFLPMKTVKQLFEK
jgi:ribosomal protein S18 acetylase RimI-like enzyme